MIAIPTQGLVFGLDDCLSLVSARSRGAKKKNLLVFIHGYNNSLGDAVSRARAFAEDIQFSGLVLIWSWPSVGQRFGYELDQKAISWSTDHFIEFATRLMKSASDLHIDFVAHSMGNRILVDLAAALKRERGALGRALIFAAPDVADDEFVQKVTLNHFQTLYASRQDRAVKLAGYLHTTRRAGGAGEPGILIVDGVESVDAILQGHSYVYEDPRALRDLARLLKTQDRASLRGLTERMRGSSKYWVINP